MTEREKQRIVEDIMKIRAEKTKSMHVFDRIPYNCAIRDVIEYFCFIGKEDENDKEMQILQNDN